MVFTVNVKKNKTLPKHYIGDGGVAHAGAPSGAMRLCGRPFRQFVDAAFYNAKAYNYLTLAHFTLTYRFPKCQYCEQPAHFPSPPPTSGREAESPGCTLHTAMMMAVL